MPFPKVSVLESVDCIVKQLKIPVQGHSKDFSRGGGGGVTLCHTQGTYQIGMSTSTPCFTKSYIFSDEQ